MKPIDEESDTDDELGLWEVDAQGEPITSNSQTTVKPASASSTVAHPEISGAKISALKQGKLPVSRESVPLKTSNAPKRKRSVSVGTKPSTSGISGDLRSIKPRRDSLPDAALQVAKKTIIDVDLVCPNCMQELEPQEQHCATCHQRARKADFGGKIVPMTGSSKQPKITSLFNRKRT
jgi:hypothetical protein